MRRYIAITAMSLFFLVLHLPGYASAGSISGTVKVKGLRSPANVLVYVTEAPPVFVDLSTAKFVMDQRDLTFVPHILPILVGSSVQFPNNDKVAHNVFSLSRTKTFNLGSYKPGESKTIVFDKPGIVELRCDVHAEMAAYILVMKNPYWAITGEKGQFRIPDTVYLERNSIKGIKDLPNGEYFLKTWHEKLKSQKVAVDVRENGGVSIQLDLTRGAPSVLYK